MQKMVITCAVTGAETTREHTPHVPITPEEIAESAYQAYLAGAAICHLHVRDKDGNPTQDLEVFKEAISLIRDKCDIVIEVTTGGAVGMTPKERLQPVTLKPDMASLDCGTVNFGDDYIVNTLPVMREFATQMNELGVKPTLECFDMSHIYASKQLIKEGLLKPPYHYGFVMNVPGGVPYNATMLAGFLKELPPESYWTVIGVGKTSVNAVCGALSFGGFIRVGFEDCIFYSKGVLAESNAQMVERAASLAKTAGFELASPGDVRKLFGLKDA
jgi:3-keto-5-aminohexanoate cleavage enzyme